MSALESGWVVAVDGGGSKIAIAAIRTDGLDEHSHRLPESLDQARQWHFPGTGSAHPSSWLTAASNLQRGLWTVTSELLQSGLPIHCLLLSLAGAGRPEDRARVLESIRPTLPRPVVTSASVACVGDIDPLVDYHCDTPHINTLAVIVGTGSITAARDPQGQIVRAGGWGPLLGDECSGGVLGLEALRALVRAIDQGLCLDNLPEFLSVIVQKIHELSPQSQSSNLNTRLIELAADRTRAATLAGTVLEHAYGSQDPTALQLVEPQISALAWQIAQVHQRAFASNNHPNHIVFSGGLAEHHPALRSAIQAACLNRGITIHQSILAQPLLAALRSALMSRPSM